MIIKFRRCEHCRHKYTYNPSTGDFGLICPKCFSLQTNRITTSDSKKLFN